MLFSCKIFVCDNSEVTCIGEVHLHTFNIQNVWASHLDVLDCICTKCNDHLLLVITYCVVYYRLSSLKQLKVLDVSYNNFTQGLPTVIAEITSLETLKLKECQLSELPERYEYNM